MDGMTRRAFGQTLAAAGAAPRERSNIVFICSDQHSGRVLGCNGHPVVKTPNLDRLAARGVLFENAYSANPLCAPARASLMTGLYASDVASYCNATCFDGRRPSWANLLRDHGYFCWATGKLDLEQGRDYGFEERQTSHGHSRAPDITSFFRAPLCFRPAARREIDGSFKARVHPDTAAVERATGFLRERPRLTPQPWAMYLGLNLPHPPFAASGDYAVMYPPASLPPPVPLTGDWERQHPVLRAWANHRDTGAPIPEERVRRARAAYYAMVTELDSLAGRVLEAVDLSNTVVVYTSDHGEMLGDHGLWSKCVLLENSVRVPLILAGPGLPRGARVTAPVSHVDLVSTVLDLAGVAAAAGLRGRSLLPLANGEDGGKPDLVFSESHSAGICTGCFMVRRGDWKYIHYTGFDGMLFDLKNDPGERRNLAGSSEGVEIERDLKARLISLVNPEAVTESAFAEQERRLRALVASKTKQEFFDLLKGRLGEGQARMLANQLYRKLRA